MSIQMLPLPPYFRRAGNAQPDFQNHDVFDLQLTAAAWVDRYSIKPVDNDRKRIHLLVLDQQYDFSCPQGSLFLGGQSGTGAVDDTVRLAEFIYRHLHIISEVTCTMDSHLPYQVFFPSAHVFRDGSHPGSFTIITEEDYRSGTFHANP